MTRTYDDWKLASPDTGPECPKCGDALETFDDGGCVCHSCAYSEAGIDPDRYSDEW